MVFIKDVTDCTSADEKIEKISLLGVRQYAVSNWHARKHAIFGKSDK